MASGSTDQLGTRIITSDNGKLIYLSEVIYSPACSICFKHFLPQSMIVSVSEPVCVLVHANCWHRLNLKQPQWPHKRESVFYSEK
jgi:hypothetical protein